MGKRKRNQGPDLAAPASSPASKKNKKQHAATSQPTSKPDPAPQPQPEPPHIFLPDPKGADLKAEVALYERLSSENPNERLAAAEAVISGLLGNGSSGGVDQRTLLRHLEKKTLIRGLASGRKAARLGFSVVLTEIWSQLFAGDGKGLAGEGKRYPDVTFEKCYELLKEKMTCHSAVGGQEERDHKFGLLFGLQSFVKSDVIFGKGNEGRWDTVFGDLLKLAETKSWLREVCGSLIVQALGRMSQKQAEKTLEKIQEAGLGASPEGVGIWLTARKTFPDMRFPSKPWGINGNPLEHLKKLAKALKESSDPDGGKDGNEAKPTGNWNPQLHFVWDLVLDRYIETESFHKGLDSEDRKEFENFWKVAVDENLFSESASRERKFWGFLVFQKMLRNSEGLLECIFSKNLMRCLINQLSNSDRFLHRAADKSLKVLQSRIEEAPYQSSKILAGLTGNYGVYNFDQVTKTKTIDKILNTIEGKTAVAAMATLQQQIISIDKSDSSQDADLRRQLFGDYVLTMIRHSNHTGDGIDSDATMVKNGCIPVLAKLAYEMGNEYKPELSDKSRTLFRNRLASGLAHVISYPSVASHIPGVVVKINPNAVNMDGEIKIAEELAKKTLKKLEKEAAKADRDELGMGPSQALSLLYALVILQLWNGEADAVTVLDELKLCYDKLIRGMDSDSGAEASAVLVEILLSFMSKPSLLLRKAAQQVFAAFSGSITDEGLKLMTDVLESGESLKGQQDLFDQNDEEVEEDDDDDDEHEEDDELDSDVEMVETNGVNGAASSSEEEEDEDDNEAEEIEDDDEGAESLDAALAKALGTHRLDQDLQEESSDSDADMTDSEMEKLGFDTKLNEIFSQRKKQPNKKKEHKDARENIIHFKTRVLDLLDIYVKRQAKIPIAFNLLLPLLKLMRTTSAKQLTEKAHGVISTFVKASKGLKKDEKTVLVDTAARIDLLRLIHEEASRDPSHAFAKAASSASLLAASSLYREDKNNFKRINAVYAETEERWMNGEAKLQAGFFVDKVNWCQSLVQSASSH